MYKTLPLGTWYPIMCTPYSLAFWEVLRVQLFWCPCQHDPEGTRMYQIEKNNKRCHNKLKNNW